MASLRALGGFCTRPAGQWHGVPAVRLAAVPGLFGP
jgi:hypothetical protein